MNMEVSISEQNLAHIMRKVESGRYSSADEVLGSALALLDERDVAVESELEDMHKSVRQGTDQADSGQVVPAVEVFSELRQRNATEAKRVR